MTRLMAHSSKEQAENCYYVYYEDRRSIDKTDVDEHRIQQHLATLRRLAYRRSMEILQCLQFFVKSWQHKAASEEDGSEPNVPLFLHYMPTFS